jgi:putative transposase
MAWATDVTCIRTWQGWLYPAELMDLVSRSIIGWSTSPTIRRELVLDAWWRFCKPNHLEPSMSRKANGWDDAGAESHFGSERTKRIKKHIHKDRDVATKNIRDHIEAFYSRTRRHSHLGGVSSDELGVAARWRRGRVQ